MLIKSLYRDIYKYVGKEITLQGWIRKSRFSKNVGFIELNDGSFFKPAQVVIESSLEDYEKASHFSNSSSIEVTGKVVETPNAKQAFEIQANSVKLLGMSDSD